MMTSQNRIMDQSVIPPIYPEIPPMSIPPRRAVIMLTKPMVRDILAPQIMRDSMSRPSRSAPSRNTGSPSSVPKRWVLDGIRPKSL